MFRIGLPISLYIDIVFPISEIQHKDFGGEELMCYDKHCGRRFLTTEEKIERLEEYKKWLDNEGKGVEEAISKLKKAS